MIEDQNSNQAELIGAQKDNGQKTWFQILPASIILAALIVAGSVFYTGRQFISKIEALSSLGLNLGGNAVAGNNQPIAGKTVDINLRKDAPVIGQGKGKLTLVEFSDFQCPFCQRFFQQSLNEIKTKYLDTGKVKMVFQHFPLPFHQNAQIAGQAAECAARQGKFEAYHDVLFTKGQADGKGLASEDLKSYAREVGLNSSKFNECLDQNQTAEVVKADMAIGQSVGVSGTPSFLLIKDGNYEFDAGLIASAAAQGQSVVNLPNGNVFIVGAQPATVFEQAIEAALK